MSGKPYAKANMRKKFRVYSKKMARKGAGLPREIVKCDEGNLCTPESPVFSPIRADAKGEKAKDNKEKPE